MHVTETDPGPFSFLQQCRREGGRVRVTIRHCAGVRGVCEGTVLVYDKHLNLVLCDVTEWCNPLRTVGNGGITESKKARRRREKRQAGGKSGPQEHTCVGNSGLGHDGSDPGQGDNSVGQGPVGEGNSCLGHTAGRGPGQGDKSGPGEQKWEVCRTVKQLFVRGDNIIHITRGDGDSPLTTTMQQPCVGSPLTTTDTLANQ